MSFLDKVESRYQVTAADDKTTFDGGTDPKVEKILESARLSKTRLRLEYGDNKTGKAWGDSYTGTIGRSMGPIKVPLLIKTVRSMGGQAILTANIVRITKGGTEIYRHPKYQPYADK